MFAPMYVGMSQQHLTHFDVLIAICGDRHLQHTQVFMCIRMLDFGLHHMWSVTEQGVRQVPHSFATVTRHQHTSVSLLAHDLLCPSHLST